MIVETKMGFRADILPPRTRLPRSSFVVDKVAVRVREVDAKQAPVVLTLPNDREDRIAIRCLDGLLWTVVDVDHGNGRQPVESMEEAIRWHVREGCLGNGEAASKRLRIDTPDEFRIVSTQRDLVWASCQRFVDSWFLVVDGVLHRRAMSPTFPKSWIQESYGKDVADLVPGSFVPSWFAPVVGGVPLRSLLLGRDLLRDLAGIRRGKIESILETMDVEISDTALFAEARSMEAANVHPEKVLADIVERHMHDRRPHLSIGEAIDAGKPLHAHKVRSVRIARSTYDSRANAGATFAEACEAAAAVLRPMAAEDRDVSRTLLPAVGTTTTSLVRMKYTSDRKGTTFKGWGAGKRTAGTIDVEIPVLAPDDNRIFAVVGAGIYTADADGRVHFDPCWDDPRHLGSETMFVEDAASMDIANMAHTLGRQDAGRPDGRHDHLGGSLRHPSGTKPPTSEDERRRTISEFGRHRMAELRRHLVFRCAPPAIAVHMGRGPTSVPKTWVTHSIVQRASPGPDAPFLFRLDRAGEACDLARARGSADTTALDHLRLVEPAPAFDDDMWNLRVATKRIVDDADGRIVLMPHGVVTALARLDRHLETWSLDTSLVSTESHVEQFLSDASTLLTTICDPMFDDIGEEHVRRIAASSLERVLAPRTVPEPDFAEDLGDFSM